MYTLYVWCVVVNFVDRSVTCDDTTARPRGINCTKRSAYYAEHAKPNPSRSGWWLVFLRLLLGLLILCLLRLALLLALLPLLLVALAFPVG